MSNNVFENHRINTAIIIVLALLFVSVIYFPKKIWDHEAELRDEARFRMKTVGLAEKLHYQLAKEYTTDTEQLVLVVNSVRDSLLAAEQDTNYSYYGAQRIALPQHDLAVNYSDDYQQTYAQLHLDLFKKLNPHHYMDGEAVENLLDTVAVLFNAGNYTGDQTLVLDSVSLSFNVQEKYDILYQNIKTAMFNALTGSYTKYPNFSNPLVDAVMDSIAANPELNGRVDFAGLYDGEVQVDFIIPVKWEENLEKTKLALKKQFVLDSYDSATYGDTLYDMALSEFMSIMDSSDVIPEVMTLMYADTNGTVEIPVSVNTDDMETALAKRRNNLYKMLTGYNEPNGYIAEQIIAVALDSLSSPGVGIDSIHWKIDLSNAVFTINIHKNISDYFNKVSLDQAYYHTHTNLSDLDWEQAAIDVVESVATSMKKHTDFRNWQVVGVPADTFYVDVYDEFLRQYDDMNLELYEKLTGEFTNIHDFAYNVISEAERLAAIDSLNWSGQQHMTFGPDTLQVDVFPKYLEEYAGTFTIARDTVVQVDDSTFKGVWNRQLVDVVQETGADTLAFIAAADNGSSYDYHGADSVRSINILEKVDTLRVEKVYYGQNTYIMLFSDDSLVHDLYRVTDEHAEIDSADLTQLHVVSDEFVVGDQEKDLFMSKDSFGGWLDTLISKKYVKKQLFAHYLLSPELVSCPVTGLPFRVTVRNNVNLAIESPIKNPIKSRRYLFFTEIDSSAGRIEDGEESWVK